MRLIQKAFIGAVFGALGLLMFPVVSAARAQDGRTIRCESTHGKFNRCEVPWRDVELARQESKGDCIRGQSWDVDRRGLWVDRGCRGLFVQARHRRSDDRRPAHGGWQPGPGWNRPIRLQCDSNKNSYQLCQVDVGRHGQVRLVNRMSDARCIEGSSWGWNRAGVWVDRGCRAQFVVDRRW
ncbi:MAG: DUF3011 domain-containing protein [Rhodanobacter sp.]